MWMWCETIVMWGESVPGVPYNLQQIELGPAAMPLEYAQSVGYCGA